MLVQVTAPHFCAGLVLENDVVVEAAPILSWTLRRSRRVLSQAFRTRGWSVRIVKHC